MADAPVTKAQLDAALDAKATDLLERTEKVETTLLRIGSLLHLFQQRL